MPRGAIQTARRDLLALAEPTVELRDFLLLGFDNLYAGSLYGALGNTDDTNNPETQSACEELQRSGPARRSGMLVATRAACVVALGRQCKPLKFWQFSLAVLRGRRRPPTVSTL